MPDYDPFDDSNRAARDEERRQREREERTQEQIDIQLLMDEPHGRRVAHRLLERAGCFRMSFVEDNPHKTSFNEGGRNLGNWLLAQLMRDTPELYAQMLKENTDA